MTPPKAPPISAVVLAAGSSSRFGENRNKLLAEWRGRTLIEYVIDAATNARVAGLVREVLVVSAADAPRVKSLAVASGCRTVHPPAESPMSASVRTAVAAIDHAAEGMLVLLGDQPMVTQAAIRAVLEAAAGSPQALVRAHYQGIADPVSHPAYIGRYHFARIHQLEGDKGLMARSDEFGLRWTEVWLEGDNPDIDHVRDLGRLP
ncbi:MAG: NTP transferase domain-containing protein [Gemmatimonadales bacterium]